MRTRSQRLWEALSIVGLLALVACGPAAAPSPTAAPAKPAAIAPAAKPTGATPSAPKPTEAAPSAAKPDASPPGKPAASADWKAEWDKVVAEAKKEGKVVVAGAPGSMYRDAASGFRKAYPEIQLEYTGFPSPDLAPKLIAERKGGLYLWDVYEGSPAQMLDPLKPQGIIDPVKPILLLPEVLDNSKWLGGFEEGWMDKEHQYVYNFMSQTDINVHVNRDLVPESELSSFDQILEPKWKGKMVSRDPRVAGKAAAQGAHFVMIKGEDFLRKLYLQDLVILNDPRQHIEALVRGRYPIGLAADRTTLLQFKAEGLWGNIKPLDPDSSMGTKLNAGFGNVSLINKAPHPNAAKVFINWLLSQEGQKVYASVTEMNSRRFDVEGPAETAPDSNVKYARNVQLEENLPIQQRVYALAKELLK